MIKQLPAPKGALVDACCNESSLLGARRTQVRSKALPQAFFVWLYQVSRWKAQLQSLHSSDEMRPLCLGIFELEMVVLCASHNVHLLKEGYHVSPSVLSSSGACTCSCGGPDVSLKLGTVRDAGCDQDVQQGWSNRQVG